MARLEGRSLRSAWVGRAIVLLITSALGLALLGLAIPRTVAAWMSIEAQPALDALQNGKRPADAELARGVTALQGAILWAQSARRLTDLALLELEQAERLPAGDPARASLLARAEDHLVGGVTANPANGFAWLRLAIVRELRQEPPRLVASSLVQSLDVAPNMRKLWLPRASMLFSYWRHLMVDELVAVRVQVRTIWFSDKAMRLALLQQADRSGQVLLIPWAIGEDAQALAEFDLLRQSLATPPSR
jgi:hypothetical protein